MHFVRAKPPLLTLTFDCVDKSPFPPLRPALPSLTLTHSYVLFSADPIFSPPLPGCQVAEATRPGPSCDKWPLQPAQPPAPV